MIDDEPTFRLPACPACSTVVSVERPFWRLAAHSTRARKDGGKSWIATGCKHAAATFTAGKIYDDIEVIRMVEEVWAAEAAVLFEERVKGWPAVTVDKFRRELGDKTTIIGATDSLDLKPGAPTGGTFTVTSGGKTSAPIPHDAKPAAIKAAVDAAVAPAAVPAPQKPAEPRVDPTPQTPGELF